MLYTKLLFLFPIVHFRITQMVPSETMSSIAGILTEMQNAISDEGVGNYAVSANSVIISKISFLERMQLQI